MTTPEKPAAITIDKNSTAKVNIGILVAVVVTCVSAMMYLQDIEHAVDRANETLREVKAQLAAQDGKSDKHATTLIQHGDRIGQLEKDYAKVEARVRELEREK